MRLQAIRKRCLASKQLIIINGDDGAQWISDGANAYAIVGIRIRESFVQDVFGLTDKQMDKMLIRTETRPGPLYREGVQTFGEELEEMRTIWAYDQKIYALRNADGILYVPEDAILAACKPEDWITYQLTRDERGKLLVAIAGGCFVKPCCRRSRMTSPTTSAISSGRWATCPSSERPSGRRTTMKKIL